MRYVGSLWAIVLSGVLVSCSGEQQAEVDGLLIELAECRSALAANAEVSEETSLPDAGEEASSDEELDWKITPVDPEEERALDALEALEKARESEEASDEQEQGSEEEDVSEDVGGSDLAVPLDAGRGSICSSVRLHATHKKTFRVLNTSFDFPRNGCKVLIEATQSFARLRFDWVQYDDAGTKLDTSGEVLRGMESGETVSLLIRPEPHAARIASEPSVSGDWSGCGGGR
jgi:hypothetical protein